MKTGSALLFICGAALLLASLQARAARSSIVGIPGISAVKVGVVSIKERRFRATVRQRYDYSCGSAALATLLTYHYHDPVTEKAVFAEMWRNGDRNKIRREGFSLLDIKNYLHAHGYSADGYVAPLKKLTQVGIPAIALISDKGYNHFVIVKGISSTEVLVGDPSLGSRTLPRKEFDKMLVNHILFVITSDRDKAVFDSAADWHVREKAPVGLAMSPSKLTDLTLYGPGQNDF